MSDMSMGSFLDGLAHWAMMQEAQASAVLSQDPHKYLDQDSDTDDYSVIVQPEQEDRMSNPCPDCRNGDILESPQKNCTKCNGSEERRFDGGTPDPKPSG